MKTMILKSALASAALVITAIAPMFSQAQVSQAGFTALVGVCEKLENAKTGQPMVFRSLASSNRTNAENIGELRLDGSIRTLEDGSTRAYVVVDYRGQTAKQDLYSTVSVSGHERSFVTVGTNCQRSSDIGKVQILISYDPNQASKQN